MKICKKCAKEFPNTIEFFKTYKKGYLRSECRSCWNLGKEARAKKYYHEWMHNLIPQHLGMGKIMCLRCGYDRSIVAIEFHHSDPNKKERLVSDLVRTVSPWGINKHKVLEEVDKCEIICSNCHQEEHFRGGNNHDRN